MANGADDYLTKPFSVKELLARARTHLALAQVRQTALRNERALRAELERQVEERTAELTKRLQELDQFAYVTSHDLKAPLRAIATSPTGFMMMRPIYSRSARATI